MFFFLLPVFQKASTTHQVKKFDSLKHKKNKMAVNEMYFYLLHEYTWLILSEVVKP